MACVVKALQKGKSRFAWAVPRRQDCFLFKHIFGAPVGDGVIVEGILVVMVDPARTT